MPEDLAFDQGVGDRGRVDCDKGLVGACTQSMDGSGDELLTRPAFSGDDDRNIAARHHLNKVKDLPHGLAGADEFSGQAFGFDVGGQPFRLAAKLDFPLGVVQQRLEFVEIGDGLREEIAGALLDSLDSHIDAAAGRDQQNGALGVAGLQVAEQLQARDLGHHHIRNNNVGFMAVHQLFCFSCISGL